LAAARACETEFSEENAEQILAQLFGIPVLSMHVKNSGTARCRRYQKHSIVEDVRLIAPMSFTSATHRQRFPSNDCFVRRILAQGDAAIVSIVSE
jgi:hypothetical protein